MAKLHTEPSLKLLLIDDDNIIHKSIGGFLAKMGYVVFSALSAELGLEIFRREAIDIVISDIKMPGMDGLELLDVLDRESQATEVVLMTGHGDMDTAVEALRRGAFDFFRKPVVLEELLGCLQRTRRYRDMRQEKDRIQKRLEALQRSDGASADRYAMHGESTVIQKVRELIDRVAQAERTTVLIQGESGTGKELVARAIHQNSLRKEAPFISVNCTAIPDTLLESELFGHERGAFTDAHVARVGVFELGDTGTLFLDEIADMNQPAQAKILRVLEERRVRRVGGSREIPVDGRLISATNQDLKPLAHDGAFRQDLFFRLNVFVINVPPLRDRGDDVLLLTHYFLKQFAVDLRKPISGLAHGAFQLLRSYAFPGNIRELRNLIERAVILCDGDELTEADFPDLHDLASDHQPESLEDLPFDLAGLERLAIIRALRQATNNQTEAARLLGIGHDALRYRIRKLNIDL